MDILTKIAQTMKTNLTATQNTPMSQLKKVCHTIIIKPADKNLGIVLMNTDDYVTQCLSHLTDKKTYRPITEYPAHYIKQQLLNTLTNYRQLLTSHDKRLYKYLCEPASHTRVPRFYAIPRLHKEFTGVSSGCVCVQLCSRHNHYLLSTTYSGELLVQSWNTVKLVRVLSSCCLM